MRQNLVLIALPVMILLTAVCWSAFSQTGNMGETGALWFQPRPVTMQRVVRSFVDGRTTDGSTSIGTEQTTDFFNMMAEICAVPEAYPVCVKWIRSIQIDGKQVFPKPITLPGTAPLVVSPSVPK